MATLKVIKDVLKLISLVFVDVCSREDDSWGESARGYWNRLLCGEGTNYSQTPVVGK